jgi:hypothetical protein
MTIVGVVPGRVNKSRGRYNMNHCIGKLICTLPAVLCLLCCGGPVLRVEKVKYSQRWLKTLDIKALRISSPEVVSEWKEYGPKERELFGDCSAPDAICWGEGDKRLYVRDGSLTANPFEDGGGFTWCITIEGKNCGVEEETLPQIEQFWKLRSSLVSPTGARIKKGGSSLIRDETWRLAGKSIGGDFPGRDYSWSPPGGRAIVFTFRGALYIMSEDGRRKRKIARGEFYCPSWSNDGTKIAFVGCTRDIQSLYIIRLSGVEYQENAPHARP